MRSQASPRALGSQESGVAEVLGSVLLVGVTVAFGGILSFVVMDSMRPAPRVHVELQTELSSGDGTWANGNERVLVHHLGGDALQAGGLRFVLDVAGVTVTVEGPDVAAAFPDGSFSLGESWAFVLHHDGCSPLQVATIYETDGASQLLTHDLVPSRRTDCGG